MADAGTRYTDAAQAELERRFRRIYREAQEDIVKKLDEHTKRLNALDNIKRAQVDAGTLSPEEYKNWLNGQVFMGKQWKDKVDSVATSLLYANQQANDIIEGKKRAVFGENATFQAYSLEHDAGMDLSFGIYDSATVTQLIKEQPELLPRKVVNGVKDKAWNTTKIANAVTQGIIQGENIAAIAQRIAKQVGSDNMEAMTRYARTAMTGAQNAGRIEMLHEAQAMGIKVKKKWLATLDSRTRDAHANLDGQEQEVDDPFDSDLGKIMYPGDFHAHPANVWNCRCALIYVYPEYPMQNAQRRAYDEREVVWYTEETDKLGRPYQKKHTKTYRNSELISDMTYKEWKTWKTESAEYKPIELIGGEGKSEVTDSIYDYFLPQKTRDKLHEIDELKSYSDFEEYLKDRYGITLDTGLESLKGKRRNESITAVTEECKKITVAVDAYRETFGKDALSKLKKIYLYDTDLDVRAAYYFNMIGENDPLAGEIHFSQWGDNGRTIFHELAHAFQDSHALSGEDAITYAERIIRELSAENLSAYSGAGRDVYAAEQFADAFGFGFAQGTKSGVDFIQKVRKKEWKK